MLGADGAGFGSLLATYLIIPTNTGVPKYNFTAGLRQAQPLAPDRLYLSVYPAPENAYRLENHPEPVGQTTASGSTSLWAGVRLVNGYSPIRAAGVGRDWAFYTHGEIDPGMAEYLLGWEAGPTGWLATVGVDGLIVAPAFPAPTPPASEWTLVHQSGEGLVYHRRGGPLPALRSVTSLDTLPNEKWSEAKVRVRWDARQELSAEVSVPPGDRPALLVVSRPYFDGYRASLNGRPLPVKSYRGWIPIIEVPPGASGRLTMIYRPWWLVLGGTVALVSLLVAVLALGAAQYTSRR